MVMLFSPAATAQRLQAKPRRTPTAPLRYVRSRILLLTAGLALAGLGFAAGVWLYPRVFTPAAGNPALYLPVSSRALTIALIPLAPSAKVRANLPVSTSARQDTAEQLVSAAGLQELGTGLAQLYPFSYRVAEPLELPDGCFDFERGQYRTDLLLEWLVAQHNAADYRSLGVLPVDVYAPEYNFLFGQAKLGGPIAVISSARMGAKPEQGKLTPQQRWQSIVRHEFGHALGLPHIEARSVMKYSNSLDELDSAANVLTAAEWVRLKEIHPVKWETAQ